MKLSDLRAKFSKAANPDPCTACHMGTGRCYCCDGKGFDADGPCYEMCDACWGSGHCRFCAGDGRQPAHGVAKINGRCRERIHDTDGKVWICSLNREHMALPHDFRQPLAFPPLGQSAQDIADALRAGPSMSTAATRYPAGGLVTPGSLGYDGGVSVDWAAPDVASWSAPPFDPAAFIADVRAEEMAAKIDERFIASTHGDVIASMLYVKRCQQCFADFNEPADTAYPSAFCSDACQKDYDNSFPGSGAG